MEQVMKMVIAIYTVLSVRNTKRKDCLQHWDQRTLEGQLLQII